MELKELGNTGVMVSEIGLGTWKYHGGVEPLRRGIELGAFLIDTAEMYRTEELVGQAISGKRDKVFLASKVLGSHLRYDQVMKAAEASLRRLAVDCIDLYQIHWPNSRVPITETMRAMEELVDQKMVRYIGVSNFSTSELQQAQAAMTNHPIVSNQVLYSLKARHIERDLLPYCQEKHVTVMEELVDQKMVRYIGVSNFSTSELQQAAMTNHPIVSNQVLYSLKARHIERDLLPYCQEKHVTVIAYTPLADGLATRPQLRGTGGRGGPSEQDPGPGSVELVHLPAQRHRHTKVQQPESYRGKLRGFRLAPVTAAGAGSGSGLRFLTNDLPYQIIPKIFRRNL